MKMVKKILFGLVAVAAVLSLASCGIKKDDPEGIIKGTAGNYSVNYKYDGDGEYRAYKSTAYQHAGALVKVTFDKDADAGNSKFGIIFGLEEKNTGKDFYIVGVGPNPAGSGGKYYVSRFEKIANIQAPNFGADDEYESYVSKTTGENGEKETIWSRDANNGLCTCDLFTDNDGNSYTYIWYQIKMDGSYAIKIGDMTNDNVTAWKNKTDDQMKSSEPTFKTGAKSITIPQSATKITPWDGTANSKAPQEAVAVYARVQGSKTLNGKVKFIKDFKEAEDIEPID